MRLRLRLEQPHPNITVHYYFESQVENEYILHIFIVFRIEIVRYPSTVQFDYKIGRQLSEQFTFSRRWKQDSFHFLQCRYDMMHDSSPSCWDREKIWSTTQKNTKHVCPTSGKAISSQLVKDEQLSICEGEKVFQGMKSSFPANNEGSIFIFSRGCVP